MEKMTTNRYIVRLRRAVTHRRNLFAVSVSLLMILGAFNCLLNENRGKEPSNNDWVIEIGDSVSWTFDDGDIHLDCIVRAGHDRFQIKDNIEPIWDSLPPANIFRNRHPLHSIITCQNTQCAYFNKVEGKEIIKYGKSRNGRQKYLCKQCKKVFTETYDTHLYGRKLTKAQLNEIYRLLVQKHSIRSIERITGHHRDTISKLSIALSMNPKSTERIIFFSMNIQKAEMDEIWRTLLTNSKNGNYVLDKKPPLEFQP
jgi:transposase-like protein